MAIASQGDRVSERSVIERHFSRRLQVTMVGEGLLIGAVVGVIITLYRMGLSGAEGLLRRLVPLLRTNVALCLGWFVILVLAAIAVTRLVMTEPDTRGSGIPQIDAEVVGRLDMRWPRVIVCKFAEGLICTISGLSLGREGPSVQLGGMAGKAVSRLFGKDRAEEHLLVTCGAAAGMSAAFHAPLTGVLFALEEIHREFNAPLIISAMAATAMADFVTSHVLGVQPVLHFDLVDALPHIDYALVLLMGIVCGMVGAAHNRGMFMAQETLFARLRKRLGEHALVVPFLVSGVVALMVPELLCGGDAILAYLEAHRQLSVSVVLGLLVGKYLFTSLCFGSGAPGGTLLPLVIMGSLVGALFGLGTIGAGGVPFSYLNNFILLGVAGLFAASVRAPVTAVVLCFELTGSLEHLLAVTAVSLVAFVTANLLKVDPFYEHLFNRLLERHPLPDEGRYEPSEHKKLLHTHVVGVGSLVEGKTVADVAWPHNTLVVTIERAGQRVIPRGDTYLQALDELLVIMDADGEPQTQEILHELCGGRT